MARLGKVVERNGTRGGLGVHPVFGDRCDLCFPWTCPEGSSGDVCDHRPSLGRPSRVPKCHLKLVPRPRWSLGACRPVSGNDFEATKEITLDPRGVREHSATSQRDGPRGLLDPS
ncbi:hypothetical protein CRG98_012121 [Punica granatum]|uniref:Uncharacterized protein n=1 Tax=Punica granatum TaxID=22663 RepID=A0A2I0KGB1_PUNGR|nr:hypothetical protein CRG98_012121 [Punica granatum]